MSKSALFASNTSAQTLAIGDIVNFGTPVRRFGHSACIAGGNVILKESGYYDVNISVTLVPGDVGPVILELLEDGVPVTGAKYTFTATAGNVYTATIPAIVRTICCKESVLAVRLSGAGADVSNAAIVVEKV